MFVIFCFLLMIRVGCCIDDQNFDVKTVAAQENVTLTCPREKRLDDEKLYWIRIISGHQPEFLGRTFVFDYDEVNQTPHFTTKQGPGTFILHIHQTQISDTGLYYCIRAETFKMIFLRGVFLKVEAPPSDAVHPGESVSLQCSVLSDSEKKTCSEDYKVHWFRAGSHQSHPSFIYTHGDNAECGKSSQKCFYSFSKNVSVSDAGTYYCAVAACGEVMFGNGVKLDIKGQFNNYLGAAFVATMIVSFCLIWTNEKKDCNNVKTVVMYIRMSKTTDEASLIYSAPTFSRRKVTKAEKGNTLRKRRATLMCFLTTE
uniref:Ig-like domain-containing protein n=1 Tax=Salarias fasciatus TaxID=181472 RepID=A0A672INC5_SALFA